MSRANASNSSNSNVLFNNTAPSGYFFGTSGSFSTIDHGRIPSTSSPVSPTSVMGTDDIYTVDCFQIGYCSSIPAAAGGVDFALTFYDNDESLDSLLMSPRPGMAVSTQRRRGG